MNTLPRYEGKQLQKAQTFDWIDDDGNFIKQETIAAYIPNKAICNAVELTRILKRPLLLKGEPGCGKTRLAQAVAYELYGSEYHKYYFEWNVKSTTKARDGIYTFDHIRRLRDAQVKMHEQKEQKDPQNRESNHKTSEQEQEDKKVYRKFGPLGKAFRKSTREKPAVILIDEVDKADIDFPNDLLLELDQLRFTIEETGEEIEAAYPPIIFITSNDEKVLPPAFLRRCLFHFIDFPNTSILNMIIQANFPLLKNSVVQAAVAKFESLRETMKADLNTEKAASTSELIDWIRVINHYYLDALIEDLTVRKTNIATNNEQEVQIKMAVYDLFTRSLSADEGMDLRARIVEVFEDLKQVEDWQEFRDKLYEKLEGLQAKEAAEEPAKQIEAAFVQYYPTLIKSLTDFKLRVTQAKSDLEQLRNQIPN